jgi:hypothetical protein
MNNHGLSKIWHKLRLAPAEGFLPRPSSPKLDAGDRRSLCRPLTVKFVSPICILFEELLMSAWFYFPLLLPDRNICHATQVQFVRVLMTWANSFTLSRTNITVKWKTSFLCIGGSPCLNFCQFFWNNLKGSDDGHSELLGLRNLSIVRFENWSLPGFKWVERETYFIGSLTKTWPQSPIP